MISSLTFFVDVAQDADRLSKKARWERILTERNDVRLNTRTGSLEEGFDLRECSGRF